MGTAEAVSTYGCDIQSYTRPCTVSQVALNRHGAFDPKLYMRDKYILNMFGI